MESLSFKTFLLPLRDEMHRTNQQQPTEVDEEKENME